MTVADENKDAEITENGTFVKDFTYAINNFLLNLFIRSSVIELSVQYAELLIR